MKSFQLQTRSLIHKQQELGLIDTRISQLKQQLSLQESSNHIIKFKVNKILETKKNAFKDQSDYSRRLENLNQEQQNRISKIKLSKKLQEEDSMRKRQNLDEKKRLEQEVIKESSNLYQLQYEYSQKKDIQYKQQQFQKIQQQKFRTKQKLELKRIEKIENVRYSQLNKKVQLSVKFDLQQKECQQKFQEEQQLLKKLSFSQSRFQALKDDLNLAQKTSFRDYANSATKQGFSYQPLNQSNERKIIFVSPYAQIPSILNKKDVDQLNWTTKLLKPSFKDQQQKIERIIKKDYQTNLKKQLFDRTHTIESSSKLETETSKTQYPKYQSIKQKYIMLDTSHQGSSNFNVNYDKDKSLKSESNLQNNKKLIEDYQQNDTYNHQQESSEEDYYQDDSQDDQIQYLEQDQDEFCKQTQGNQKEFYKEEQYLAGEFEEQ